MVLLLSLQCRFYGCFVAWKKICIWSNQVSEILCTLSTFSLCFSLYYALKHAQTNDSHLKSWIMTRFHSKPQQFKNKSSLGQQRHLSLREVEAYQEAGFCARAVLSGSCSCFWEKLAVHPAPPMGASISLYFPTPMRRSRPFLSQSESRGSGFFLEPIGAGYRKACFHQKAIIDHPNCPAKGISIRSTTVQSFSQEPKLTLGPSTIAWWNKGPQCSLYSARWCVHPLY